MMAWLEDLRKLEIVYAKKETRDLALIRVSGKKKKLKWNKGDDQWNYPTIITEIYEI